MDRKVACPKTFHLVLTQTQKGDSRVRGAVSVELIWRVRKAARLTFIDINIYVHTLL